MLAVIIVAAGSGQRTGLPYNKLLYQFDSRTVLTDTLRVFDIHKIVVCAPCDIDKIKQLTAGIDDLTLITGGATRGESVYKGLLAAQAMGVERVLIHDGARPYLDREDLKRCIDALDQFGSCVMGRYATDSVRYQGAAIDRRQVFLVSTPQAFDLKKILQAYDRLNDSGLQLNDDASVYEKTYGSPHFEPLLHHNSKITTAEDLLQWQGRQSIYGYGFDEHRYKQGRKLVLCGVTIPSSFGCDGHSDADAPVHAVINALLTAVGLPDIGTHFPDSDPTYQDADSLCLLQRVLELVHRQGYKPTHVSLTLHAQKPKLAEYTQNMRHNLAQAMGLPISHVGIAATTGEHMGHIGRGEGLAAHAVATIVPCFIATSQK